MSENRVVYFVKRPSAMVAPDAFEVRREPMPASGQTDAVLVESLYASVDPYMRGRMADRKSYTAPFEVGQPMTGGMVGRVLESSTEGVSPGAWVFGMWPWAEYALVPARSLRVLDPHLPPTTALHVLGLTGLTAYIGLTKFGRPQAGEQLVVSAAAGAVGSLVGQIGRLMGLKVAGIAGSDEKCRWLQENLQFDTAFNYRAENFSRTLADHLKNDGVDIYFDNVGGPVTDAVMSLLNPHARIVVCGQIALYNLDYGLEERPRFSDLLISRAQASGFIVAEHQSEFPEALETLGRWYGEGLLVAEETITNGFDHLIEAFIGLFHGQNRGKAIVRIK